MDSSIVNHSKWHVNTRSHLAAPLQLRVPGGDQGVIELGQLLVQTELTLRDFLPHAHQLALQMHKTEGHSQIDINA